MQAQSLRHDQLFATPWTVALQAPQSVAFSRQKYWSGLPFSSSSDLLDPGIEPVSPSLAGGFFTTGPPGSPIELILQNYTKEEKALCITI